MIRVTTLSGDELYLNCDQIESIMEAPDTVITLTNGRRYLVFESALVLVNRTAQFKARVWRSVARRRSCGISGKA